MDYEANKKVKSLADEARDTGDTAILNDLAEEVAEMTMEAISENLKESNSIVDEGYVRGIVAPALREGYDYIVEVTMEVIEKQYDDAGVGLRAIRPEYDTRREDEIVRKIIEEAQNERDNKGDR